MSTYQKIKKYILILSVFFSVVIITHLVVIYFYDNSKLFPEQWGTISVWFIWNSPSLNPFEFWLDFSNDYILKFLYRSLLTYNITDKKIEWDIANCDFQKNFTNIKCFLKEDNFWNDWTKITKDDIVETYKYFKESDTNKSTKKLLENVDIKDNWEYLEFKPKNSDILILDIFLLPIIKKSEIDQLKLGNLNFTSLFTSSGPYNFTKKELDVKYDTKKITLTKNENPIYKNIFIWKYVFKFFNDKNSLIKNEDSLNIIFPPELESLHISPRFWIYNFILPQYIWFFLNSEKLTNLDIRKTILFHLWNSHFTELTESKWKIIKNPFFSDTIITPELSNKNISSTINDLWFFKKDFLLQELNKKYDELLKPKKVTTWLPYSTYFKAPTDKLFHFHSWAPELLISWNVSTWVQSVYINDYKLKSFIPWNTKFYFRAKTELKSLKQWENFYTLYFEINWKKIKKETLTIYYYTDKEQLNKKYSELINRLSKTHILSPQEILKIRQNKEIEKQKLQNLDNIYYYDKNYNKYTLSLYYINQWSFFDYIAKKIKDELKLIWIDVLIKELDVKWVENIISKWIKDYDMILMWVNYGHFDYNVFPFFYSWQAKTWLNFSKIKNVSLDMLLEEIKSKEFSEEKLEKIKNQILTILKNEAILKTFFSPYVSFYIDQNLKNISNVKMLPYKYYSYDIIKNSYIKEERIIDFNTKNLLGFYNWLKSFIIF